MLFLCKKTVKYEQGVREKRPLYVCIPKDIKIIDEEQKKAYTKNSRCFVDLDIYK